MKNGLRIVMLALVCLAPRASAAEIAIGGRVLSAAEPLPDAELRLVERTGGMELARRLLLDRPPEPAARAVTGADGRFRLVAPRAGTWTVVASAPGYATVEYDLVPLIEPLELPAVTLVPDVGLTVRVDGPAGRVAGATVSVRQDRSLFGSSGWGSPLRVATTDDAGVARFPHGKGKRFAVAASAPGGTHAERRGLRGGNVRVSLAKGRRQVVAVQGADGSAIAGAVVALGQRAHPVALTGADGRATITLPAEGSSELYVHASTSRWFESGIVARVDGKPFTVTLPEPQYVVGKLIDADTRAAVEGGIAWSSRGEAVATDRAGGFALAGPEGHRMRITAGAAGYLQARTVVHRLSGDGRPGPAFAMTRAVHVEGRVVGDDGKPIVGAELGVERRRTPGRMEISFGDGPELPRAVSEDAGRFRIGPLDPDVPWTLGASADGYASGEEALTGLDVNGPVEPIELTLERGRVVSGRVADAQDRPLRDAEVTLDRAATRAMGGMRIMDGGADEPLTASSDGDGRFAVRGVPRGTFDLSAERDGFARATVGGVQVAAGDEPVDLGTITLEPGERLEGSVTDDKGVPLAGVEITVESGGGGMSFMMFDAAPRSRSEPDAVTDPTGWFAVEDLAAGERYTVSYSRTGYVGASSKGVELPRVEPLAVAMKPASKVIGIVVDVDGDPVPGAQVDMERSVTREMGGNIMKMVMMMDATADADGRFEFEDQEPGSISLTAVASGYRETTLANLEIPKGKDLDGLRLELDDGAIVEGRVFAPDGRPAIGARVRLVTESDEPMAFRGGPEADGNGYYRLEGLAPGTVSVEATHDDFPRRVRDTDVSVGINSLDLHFEGGVQVAGRVTDEGGKPVPTATVTLIPASRGWGGPEARTGADGRFTMPGVQDGEYRFGAAAEGFAPLRQEQRFVVEGQPVDGVELSLARGTTLTGSISGIAPELFSRLNVRAAGSHRGGFEGAPVSFKGDYRIDNLAPGDYEIIAEFSDSGRRTDEKLTIDAGAEDVRLDLRFEPALTLTGEATQGDEPVVGATIIIEGEDVDHTGWGETALDGSFSIDGLERGRYALRLRNWQTGLAHDQTVDLGTSRSVRVRVPTAKVTGRIVDAADRRPLQGVSLTLEVDDEANPARLPSHTAATDQEGRFVIDAIADGGWHLTARRSGYATIVRQVAIEQGRTSARLDLEMEPTEGMTLIVSTPGGGFPDDVRLAVMDRTGHPVASGEYATGEAGRVRLSSVPAGDWRVALSVAGWATSNLDASAPGAPVPVSLEPPTTLVLTVPDLKGSGTTAWVTVTDAGGNVYRAPSWSGRPTSRWRMNDGELRFESLPPGRWKVRVDSADGQSWSDQAETTPGIPTAISLG